MSVRYPCSCAQRNCDEGNQTIVEHLKLVIGKIYIQKKQAGLSCAQPQADAVSLEEKASFLLKIYISVAKKIYTGG